VDPSRVPVSGYFNNLVASLVSYGYERGVSIRGAPYDFRKAPSICFIEKIIKISIKLNIYL
jgi:lysophospholipase-3